MPSSRPSPAPSASAGRGACSRRGVEPPLEHALVELARPRRSPAWRALTEVGLERDRVERHEAVDHVASTLSHGLHSSPTSGPAVRDDGQILEVAIAGSRGRPPWACGASPSLRCRSSCRRAAPSTIVGERGALVHGGASSLVGTPREASGCRLAGRAPERSQVSSSSGRRFRAHGAAPRSIRITEAPRLM